jgi:hypothetical protein
MTDCSELMWKVMDASGEMHYFDTTMAMVAFVKENPGCIIQAVRGECATPEKTS